MLRYNPAGMTASMADRWLSPDPVAGDILNPQSLNRYAYVLNNPTTLTDPLGLCEAYNYNYWSNEYNMYMLHEDVGPCPDFSVFDYLLDQALSGGGIWPRNGEGSGSGGAPPPSKPPSTGITF